MGRPSWWNLTEEQQKEHFGKKKKQVIPFDILADLDSSYKSYVR
jgi:hypothetical protein